MPRFHLLAASDGDLVDETAEFADEESAQIWAAELLTSEFGLEFLPDTSWEEIGAETDGCSLEELPPDKLEEAAVELLRVIGPTLSIEQNQPLLERSPQHLVLLEKASALAGLILARRAAI